jgi:hypothetical protein
MSDNKKLTSCYVDDTTCSERMAQLLHHLVLWLGCLREMMLKVFPGIPASISRLEICDGADTCPPS